MSDPSRGPSGTDRLLESLWLDARREAEQNLARARAQSGKLLADIRDYRDKEFARAHERAREKAVSEMARILNRARGTIEKATLEGRYRFLDDCLTQARTMLNRNEETAGAARAAFDSLFRQAAVHFDGSSEVQITINPADRKKARAFASKAGFECKIVEEEGISGGVRIETADGSYVVDNTIDSRLTTLGERPPVEILDLTVPGSLSENPSGS
jgi:vacuolar-type H+-ATPase subunit E/Vma4